MDMITIDLTGIDGVAIDDLKEVAEGKY